MEIGTSNRHAGKASTSCMLAAVPGWPSQVRRQVANLFALTRSVGSNPTPGAKSKKRFWLALSQKSAHEFTFASLEASLRVMPNLSLHR